MRHVNYKSDFTIRETIRDIQGEIIPIFNHDVTITYSTNKFKKYIISVIDGVFTNCRADEQGALIVVFDNHNLGQGYLTREFKFALKNGVIPDFIEDILLTEDLNIELWNHDSDSADEIDSEILLNYAKGEKGDPFRFEDFTPEQILILQKPAIDAAEHPTCIGQDYYVYKWDYMRSIYVKTDIYVKGDSGVYVGQTPSSSDKIWIDPTGEAATANDILTDSGKTVQEELDARNTGGVGIEQYQSYLSFPTIGNESILYVDQQANKSYRWNKADMHYYIIGANYDEISIINGGNAQNN